MLSNKAIHVIMSNSKPRPSIEECINAHLEVYFADLGKAEPHAIYPMILGVVEKAVLQQVLQKAEGKQGLAAAWLGINRNTLRKKLLAHGLI